MTSSLARIDLTTLAKNVKQIRALLPKGLKVLFAVKSDGYGHGIEAVSRTAEEVGIEYLGAVTVEEGVSIRHAGVKLPVLMLGPVPPSETRLALELNLTFQVSDIESARFLARLAEQMGKKARVHVNVDTGMGRFGVRTEDAVALLAQLRETPALNIEGIFSHLSVADSELPEDQSYTLKQINHFKSVLAELDRGGLLPSLRHIGNSAGVIQYKDRVTSPPMNMVRIGTLFYGYLEVKRPWAEVVAPVATLTAQVIGVKELFPGDYVGYGRTYKAPGHQRIAILSIGYGSGINPRLSNCGKVWLNGKYAPIIGKIYLDHMVVDVTSIDKVSVGDEVEVFGPHLPADRLANMGRLAVCEVLVPALRGASGRMYK